MILPSRQGFRVRQQRVGVSQYVADQEGGREHPGVVRQEVLHEKRLPIARHCTWRAGFEHSGFLDAPDTAKRRTGK